MTSASWTALVMLAAGLGWAGEKSLDQLRTSAAQEARSAPVVAGAPAAPGDNLTPEQIKSPKDLISPIRPTLPSSLLQVEGTNASFNLENCRWMLSKYFPLDHGPQVRADQLPGLWKLVAFVDERISGNYQKYRPEGLPHKHSGLLAINKEGVSGFNTVDGARNAQGWLDVKEGRFAKIALLSTPLDENVTENLSCRYFEPDTLLCRWDYSIRVLDQGIRAYDEAWVTYSWQELRVYVKAEKPK